MAGFYPIPATIEARLVATVPTSLYSKKDTEWLLPSNLARCPIFLEGITTDKNGNIFVVDVPYGRILKVDLNILSKQPEDEGHAWSVVADWEGEPNGMVIDQEGYLLVADYKQGIVSEHVAHAVAESNEQLKIDPSNGNVAPLITRRNLERFKGPNDLIVAKNGDLYFTDQGQTGLTDQTGHVYRLSPSGKLDALITNGPSPNGLVLSPDEMFLYVAMTRDNSVWRCPLHRDGTTTKVNRFFQSFGTSGPDGLTIDNDLNLFISHPGLSCVFVVNKRGIPKARIVLPGEQDSHVTNCIFGARDGMDRNVLYFVDSTGGRIYAVDWEAEGGTPYEASRVSRLI